MPAARAASSRLIPSEALASASSRLLTRPSRSRRASARSSAGVRPVAIGTATMAQAPGLLSLPGQLAGRRRRSRLPVAGMTTELRKGGGGDGALLCLSCSVPTIAHQVAQARVPGRKVRVEGTATPALEAVTDGDRDWFLAHPHRRFRLRPATLDELPAGSLVVPGLTTIVTKVTDDLRMRCFV